MTQYNAHPVMTAFTKFIWLLSDLTKMEDEAEHGRVEPVAKEESSWAILSTVFFPRALPACFKVTPWKLTESSYWRGPRAPK